VRLFRHASAHAARAFVVASLFVAAGCGGGGSSGTNPVPPFFNGICDPGTNVSLAFPNNTQGNFPTGVSTGIGRVEIVANGNNNTLFNSYAQFDTILVSNFGQVQGGFLTLTSDNGGPHPYASDFYYNSSIGGLQSNTVYTVYLNVPSNSSCQPVAIGQFAT
jgi:hypothetical protein